MKKRLIGMVFLTVLCVMCMTAVGEARTYIYGGSGTDVIYHAAASVDGRIVLTGVTDSSDGTLGTRTKSGQAGWVLCIDQNGEVLWNFCRHAAKYERMETPVWHEDGSLTVLFWMEKSGFSGIELVHISAQGEMLSAGTIAKSEDKMVHLVSRGVYPGEGYVIGWMDKREGVMHDELYDFAGDFVRALEEEINLPQDQWTDAGWNMELTDGTGVNVQNIEQSSVDVQVTFES